jgi:hypothetical protein
VPGKRGVGEFQRRQTGPWPIGPADRGGAVQAPTRAELGPGEFELSRHGEELDGKVATMNDAVPTRGR